MGSVVGDGGGCYDDGVGVHGLAGGDSGAPGHDVMIVWVLVVVMETREVLLKCYCSVRSPLGRGALCQQLVSPLKDLCILQISACQSHKMREMESCVNVLWAYVQKYSEVLI